MRRRHRVNGIVYVLIALGIFVGIISTIFALINSTNSKIISNITINNIKVSGLTKQEAEDKLQKLIDGILEEQITLKHGEYEKTVTLKHMELEVNVQDKVYEACTIGRDKSIVTNNYKILQIMLFGEKLEFDFKFNEEIVKSIYNNLDDEWEDKFIDNSYYIEGDKLIIVKGEKGVVIDETALSESINKLIQDNIEGKKVTEIDIPTVTKEPQEIDIRKIREEIHKEAQNASYDKSTSTLTVHVNGVDLDVSIEEAENILAEDKKEYEIPLQITKPDITTDNLGEEAFPEKLGSFSTRYDASNINRSKNIELAAEAINGTILLPGERFSFNGTVGPRTSSKGYLLAGAYSAGELVESYGGGVCQVSSTVYNAALFANLEIVERYNHSMVVSYVDCGRDATVSYGSRDFKFKNSRTYAIKLKAEAKNGILLIEVWGIPEKEEFEIELASEVTDVTVCNTKYVYDSSLAHGQEVVQTPGANGAKSIAYKITKKNGRIISKDVLSEDSYNPMTRVVKTGDRK